MKQSESQIAAAMAAMAAMVVPGPKGSTPNKYGPRQEQGAQERDRRVRQGRAGTSYHGQEGRTNDRRESIRDTPELC